MKRLLAAIGAMIVLLMPVIACASTWKIDPEHSHIGFKVRHLMVSNVRGNFEKFSGKVEMNDTDIARSRVEVSIETGSINTGVEKRDEHLRSPDFFDVAKHPLMTFVSRKVAPGANGRLKISGDLTIHGITREVVLDVEPISPESRDPWGNIRRGTTASATINRKDFGLTWNKALETGGVVVGDEVTITLEVELIKSVDK